MSRHTPGPWTVDQRCIQAPDGNIALLNLARSEQETQANARLIAAAPEMLEALKPIAAAYPDDPGTSDLYDEQPVSITLGDVRRVWAALRKAGVR